MKAASLVPRCESPSGKPGRYERGKMGRYKIGCTGRKGSGSAGRKPVSV
jgi:hypothetical protein